MGDEAAWRRDTLEPALRERPERRARFERSGGDFQNGSVAVFGQFQPHCQVLFTIGVKQVVKASDFFKGFRLGHCQVALWLIWFLTSFTAAVSA
jgi:hypothetical protein